MNWLHSIFLVLLCSTQCFGYTLQFQKWQTANGATVIYYPTQEVPMLDIYIAFRAGSAYDGKYFGLSTLTTELLSEGSGNLNANQISEKLAETGAQYNVETSRNLAVIHLRSLSENTALENATDLLSLIINKPYFPQDAFYRERNQLLTVIAHTKDSPDEIANQTFFQQLYQNHPYAHPINGTTETVRALQPWQPRNFYKQYFNGANATLVIVGDIKTPEAHALADKLIGSLPNGSPAAPLPKPSPLNQAIHSKIPFPATQTAIRIGQLGINHQSPQYFPLMVANYILGGSTIVSELGQAIREKRGLSYNVNSELMPMPEAGPFIISLSTLNHQAQEAIQISEDTLKHFLQNGPTEKELQAAKQYLTGSFALSLASNNNIALMLLRLEVYHLPEDFLDTYAARIEHVTQQEIKNALQALIIPEHLLTVEVGKM